MMRFGIMSEQRDIVLFPFPYSNLKGAKLRPALIISNSKLKNDKICCLITSNPFGDGLPIKNSFVEKGKLPVESWIKPYRLFTVDKRVIRKNICKINKEFYRKVLKGINEYLV